MKLNRKVEYALIALKYMWLKAPGELTTAREISRKFATPFDVQSRVLQVLAQKEILKSEQGATGGYQIIRDLSRVSFSELHDMVLGPLKLVKCLDGSSCELSGSCGVTDSLQFLTLKMNQLYASLSVLEIIMAGQSIDSNKKSRQNELMETMA